MILAIRYTSANVPVPRDTEKKSEPASKATIEDRSLYPDTPPRSIIPIQSLNTGVSVARAQEPDLAPDQLKWVRHEGGTRMRVHFADGLEATVDMADFGADLTGYNMGCAKTDRWGTAVFVKNRRGRWEGFDSSVFRSYSDPKYAAEIAAVIADYYARGGEPAPPPPPPPVTGFRVTIA